MCRRRSAPGPRSAGAVYRRLRDPLHQRHSGGGAARRALARQDRELPPPLARPSFLQERSGPDEPLRPLELPRLDDLVEDARGAGGDAFLALATGGAAGRLVVLEPTLRKPDGLAPEGAPG